MCFFSGYKIIMQNVQGWGSYQNCPGLWCKVSFSCLLCKIEKKLQFPAKYLHVLSCILADIGWVPGIQHQKGHGFGMMVRWSLTGIIGSLVSLQVDHHRTASGELQLANSMTGDVMQMMCISTARIIS